eukprot:4090471-Prymnesium_polylepis.1
MTRPLRGRAARSQTARRGRGRSCDAPSVAPSARPPRRLPHHPLHPPPPHPPPSPPPHPLPQHPLRPPAPDAPPAHSATCLLYTSPSPRDAHES